jgi:hypothetical protein
MCRIIRRNNVDTKTIDFIADLPEPPTLLGVIVGDCLHNLRSSLDHLVWQLVEANPPHHGTVNNQFPIYRLESDFHSNAGRRLAGVPANAIEDIKRLQPYMVGNSYKFHPLWQLNELVNVDKHRTLMLTSAVLRDWQMYLGNPDFIMPRFAYSSTEISYHGAIIATVPFDAFTNPDEVEMHFINQGYLIASKDALPIDRGIDETLDSLIDFVKDEVVPRFRHFFNH